jgi:hypothetical protein
VLWWCGSSRWLPKDGDRPKLYDPEWMARRNAAESKSVTATCDDCRLLVPPCHVTACAHCCSRSPCIDAAASHTHLHCVDVSCSDAHSSQLAECTFKPQLISKRIVPRTAPATGTPEEVPVFDKLFKEASRVRHSSIITTPSRTQLFRVNRA